MAVIRPWRIADSTFDCVSDKQHLGQTIGFWCPCPTQESLLQ